MPKNSAQTKKSSKKRFGLKREIMFLCACCACLILLTLSLINLNLFVDNKRVLGVSYEQPVRNTSSEIAFWQELLAKNPTYFDGWIELAGLSFEAGDKETGYSALNKARQINPNSEKLKMLEESLGY